MRRVLCSRPALGPIAALVIGMSVLCGGAGMAREVGVVPELSTLIVDPAGSAEAVRSWFLRGEGEPGLQNEEAALVILKRLSDEAAATGLAGQGIGLRRSKDRRALAADALARLEADGINPAAIARRSLAKIAAIGGPVDLQLMRMSSFLGFLAPEEEIQHRLRLISTGQGSVRSDIAKGMLPAMLRAFDRVESPAARLSSAKLLGPVLKTYLGEAALPVLAGRLGTELDPALRAALLAPVLDPHWTDAILAERTVERLAQSDFASARDFASAIATNATRDRLMENCTLAALNAGEVLNALGCARAIEHPDLRNDALRRVSQGFLNLGQISRAEAIIRDMSTNAPEAVEAHRILGDAEALAFLARLMDPAKIETSFGEPVRATNLARLPVRSRRAVFTALARQGLDLDVMLAATQDPALREAVERDAALAEISAGKSVDAELRWRAMPLGRAWFHLGTALFLEARIAEDDELAGEIRSQLLVAASDGLSRFDADISALMLALTSQDSSDYQTTAEADVLIARLAALDQGHSTALPARMAAPSSNVGILRALAEQGAASLDAFGLLTGRVRIEPAQPSPDSKPASDARESGGVTITASVAPRRPDRLNAPRFERRFLGSAHVAAQLPLPGNAKAALVSLNKQSGRYFEDILGTLSSRDHIFAAQQTTAPRFIRIMSGVTTPLELARQLRAEAADIITINNGIVRFHVPVVIGRDATLILDTAEATQFELDSAAGAFLVNAGTLQITDASLTATGDAGPFRAFITSWSGSRTILAGATLEGLGYGGRSAHGLTIRSGPQSVLGSRHTLPPPSALIVDSAIEGLYSGFLAHKAKNVVLVGNSIIEAENGGLSPRDGTEGFFAAYNTVRKVKGGPAIFVTGGVNGAVLIGNQTLGNDRSGLVLDRYSNGAFSYANRSAGNGGDGMALFESSCAAVLTNAIEGNRRAGLKLRNSQDVGVFSNRFFGNQGPAIRAYIASVPKLGGPVTIPALVTLDAGWNLMSENGRGLSLEGVSSARLFANRFLRQSPRLFAGDIKGHAGRLLRDQESGAAIVKSSACRPKRPAAGCLANAWLADLTSGLPSAYPDGGDEALCLESSGSIQQRAIKRSTARPKPAGAVLP